MKTIEGLEINLKDVVIFNIAKDNSKEIAMLINNAGQKYSESKDNYIASRILNNEENINILIHKMKQIDHMDNAIDGVIKVTYEDGLEVLFKETRKELLSDIFTRQQNIKHDALVRDNWDTLTPEQKATKKKNYKERRKNGIVAGIVAASLLVGTGAGYALSKKNKDKQDVEDNPYASVQNMTESEIEENKSHSTVTIREDREYSFDANDSEVIAQKGLELYKEVANKNLLLLTSGEIVKWDETLSTEIVEYINGLTPEAIKVMDLASGKQELEKLQQAILLITASSTSAENKWEEETVDLSDYVSDEFEKNIMHNSLVYSRRIHDETVGNPVNGEIIESDEEFNKVSKSYENAESALLYYIKDTMNDSYYLDAPASTRWTIVSTLRDGITQVRKWISIIDTSKEEEREALYPVVYFIDNVNNTKWFAVEGETDAFGGEIYEEEDFDCNKLNNRKSVTEMYAYAEANPNIVRLGIERELDDERVRSEEAFIDTMLLYEKANTK